MPLGGIRTLWVRAAGRSPSGPLRSTSAGLAVLVSCLAASCALLSTGGSGSKEALAARHGIDPAQVPTWSADDLEFFLHGTMSTEVFPESALQAFMETYPDLFPGKSLAAFGLVEDPEFGWPIGFSRRKVPHLGGFSSVGLNCASCHTGRIQGPDGKTVLVLGMTAHFDAEAFFGAVATATWKTAEPENMERFLRNFMTRGSWQIDAHKAEIAAAIAADPTGSKGLPPGARYPLNPVSFGFVYMGPEHDSDVPWPDFGELTGFFLKLFHNMRASLHIPDDPPKEAPPVSGPSRNDPFGLLSRSLFGVPQPYAPVKYGLVWNIDLRAWVHADGNTRSPVIRNLLASLGLGAPLLDEGGQKRGALDFAALTRQTGNSERIRPPRYPWEIDRVAAERGRAHYEARCASCHDGPEDDSRLHALAEIGTDPSRATAFDQEDADRINRFFGEVRIEGYTAPPAPTLRGTGKYWAPRLDGVWARSPYLHNGSVRTMRDLLAPPEARPKAFRRGSKVYDTEAMGYTDEGAFTLDTGKPGNAATGHAYGTDLTDAEKRDLIEHLKTK